MSASELDRLDAIAAASRYAEGPSQAMVAHTFRVFRRHIRGASILELGPAEGVMTDRLATLGADLTVVEGAEAFCAAIRERHPGVRVVRSLFEDYRPERTFDDIVLGHVLEHVADPIATLRRAATWLAPGGRVLAAVPNGRSVHRQAGVLMGLLPFEGAPSELDVHHGHRRVYNPETFRREFVSAGYRIEAFGGFFLKPVSNAQMADWAPELVEALMAVGERYPDIAAEIYVVAVQP